MFLVGLLVSLLPFSIVSLGMKKHVEQRHVTMQQVQMVSASVHISFKWLTSHIFSFSAVLARLWPGLRWLWLPQTPGQAKAIKHGLALAWPGLGQGFLVYV